MCLLRWAYCRGDSRLPAECRGSTGEADDAEPESLDSGPQVLFNLLSVRFAIALLLVLAVLILYTYGDLALHMQLEQPQP